MEYDRKMTVWIRGEINIAEILVNVQRNKRSLGKSRNAPIRVIEWAERETQLRTISD